jgi:hypothetical protein
MDLQFFFRVVSSDFWSNMKSEIIKFLKTALLCNYATISGKIESQFKIRLLLYTVYLQVNQCEPL